MTRKQENMITDFVFQKLVKTYNNPPMVNLGQGLMDFYEENEDKPVEELGTLMADRTYSFNYVGLSNEQKAEWNQMFQDLAVELKA